MVPVVPTNPSFTIELIDITLEKVFLFIQIHKLSVDQFL